MHYVLRVPLRSCLFAWDCCLHFVLGVSRRSLLFLVGFALLLHALAWLVVDGFAVATEAAASLAVQPALATPKRERQAHGDYAKSYSDYAGTRNSDELILTGLLSFENKNFPAWKHRGLERF